MVRSVGVLPWWTSKPSTEHSLIPTPFGETLGENSRSKLMTRCVFIPLVCSFLAPVGDYHVGTGGSTVPDHIDAGTPVSISWFPSPRPHLDSRHT